MSVKRPEWKAAIALGALLMLTAPSLAETTVNAGETPAEQTLEVLSDSAVILESAEPFSEIFIANPNIADISTVSASTLYILGKEPGRTTLILIREDASIISTIDVRVAPDVTELKRRLSDVLPDETIEVLPANDGLVLSGTVSGPEAVERALELATHYAKGRVSNLLNVEVQEQAPEPVPEPVAVVVEEPAEPVDTVLVQSQIRKILPDEPISVHELGGTVVLSGNVSSQERANQALQVARLIAGDAEVSNLMTVAQKKSCKMRTRRGGELVETEIPCQESS